jgi:hypothetical protein
MHIHDHAEIGGEQIANRRDDEIVESVPARAIKGQERTDIDDQTHEIETRGTDRPALVRTEQKARRGKRRIDIGAVGLDVRPPERMRDADAATEAGNRADGIGHRAQRCERGKHRDAGDAAENGTAAGHGASPDRVQPLPLP